MASEKRKNSRRQFGQTGSGIWQGFAGQLVAGITTIAVAIIGLNYQGIIDIPNFPKNSSNGTGIVDPKPSDSNPPPSQQEKYLFPNLIDFSQNEIARYHEALREYSGTVGRLEEFICKGDFVNGNFQLEITANEDSYPLGKHGIEAAHHTKSLGSALIETYKKYRAVADAINREENVQFYLSLRVEGTSDNRSMDIGESFQGDKLACKCESEITGRKEKIIMRPGEKTSNFWLGCARAGSFVTYLRKYGMDVNRDRILLSGKELNKEGGAYRKVSITLTFHNGERLFKKYKIGEDIFCPVVM